MKRHWRKWGIALCAMLTALLVGCQAVGGLNVDDVILNQLDVTAEEQSGSVDVDIEWSKPFLDSMDPQTARLLKLLAHTTLTIDQAKVDSQDRMSLQGSLALDGKKPVGFTFQADSDRMLLKLEGAKKPFLIDLRGAGVPVRPDLGGAEQPIRKLVKEAARYFVHHLPNPDKLSVSRELSRVGEENLSLTKLHAELDGQQLGSLLVQYVNALADDEAGLRTMLESIARQIAELPPETLKEFAGDADLPSAEELKAWTEQGVRMAGPMLRELKSELADLQNRPEWPLIFDKGSEWKADYYVDDSLRLRKSDVELRIAPAIFAELDFPIRSLAVKTHSEMWNINGDVSVPDVEAPADAIGPEAFDGMSAVEFLRNFEEGSTLYDIFKNDLELDDTSFTLGPDSLYGTPPHVERDGEKESVHLPLRETLDGFEDPIFYDRKSGEIRFADAGTQQEIVLHIGSSEALVNGKTVPLTVPVHLHGSAAYMGAYDLLRLLGGSYVYTPEDDGSVTVTVQRDL